jgi:SAM-dependent methyltransferase
VKSVKKERSQDKKISKDYTRVTPKSLNRFSYFHTEDKTNLTIATRAVKEYAEQLDFKNSLKKYIITFARKIGRKIVILDSGCGKCTAIDELLSDPCLDNHIQQITGVSLHYFENVKQVMTKHPGRFIYYYGTIQNVLSQALETHQKFDLILDIWGAYPYSENKLNLLRQYHDALKPSGEARILTADYAHSDLSINNNSDKLVQFSLWATQEYPEIFSLRDNKYDGSVLVIHKKIGRWPVACYEMISSQEIPSIKNQDKLSLSKLRKGNAMMFSQVIVKPIANQTMKLRALPICIA